MSADNYFLVRPVGDRWSVTLEFASDEEPSAADHPRATVFDDKVAAIEFANSQYAEYGTVVADV